MLCHEHYVKFYWHGNGLQMSVCFVCPSCACSCSCCFCVFYTFGVGCCSSSIWMCPGFTQKPKYDTRTQTFRKWVSLYSIEQLFATTTTAYLYALYILWYHINLIQSCTLQCSHTHKHNNNNKKTIPFILIDNLCISSSISVNCFC